MWRATWKGLAGHTLRMALTATAILLGVGLVAGSFVFTDTLGKVFDDLFADSFSGIDVQVRADVDPDLAFVFPERLDEDLVATVAAVEGVQRAVPAVGGLISLVGPDGEPLGGQGPPTLGGSWADAASPLRIVEGRPPSGSGEVALDAATARREEIALGDVIEVVSLGIPEPFRVVGTVGLGGSENFGGAIFAAFELSEAQRIFLAPGQVDAISVVARPGVTPEALIERIRPLLPPGVQAVTASAAAEDQLSSFKQALGFLNTFLLVFGLVALFVGAFIIQNTFQIVVAQRTRELGLLRALGASRRQVTAMVMGEALIVGVLASAAGVLAGVGLAAGIKAAFEAFGGRLPTAPLQVQPRTWIVGVGAGLGVTTVSALMPALRAGAVPPVEAMREGFRPPARASLRRRSAVGTLTLVLGAGLMATGLLLDPPVAGLSPAAVVGAGAAVVFLAVALLAPTFARPLARTLGRPLPRLLGVPGRLAKDNAARTPRRTAATASALTVGIALVSLVTLMAASIDATADALITDRFRADLVLQPTGFGGAGLSPALGDTVATLPEVASVSRFRRGPAKLDDEVVFVAATDLATVSRALRFDVTDGSLTGVGSDGVVVSVTEAASRGLAPGDMVELSFNRTGPVPLRVAAVYDPQGPGSDFLLDMSGWDANFVERFDSSLFVVYRDGADPVTARAEVERIADGFPGTAVLDQTEFRNEAAAQLGGFVNLIFALLGLALVIGFFGIANTLLLSVFERTREIGLLRAVGATRRQVRRMVTWEAVIIALFGAVLGVAIGLVFGWAIVSSLSTDTDIVLAVPVVRLAATVAAAGAAGIVAAVVPARRAAGMNVLAAIAYE